MKRLIIFIVVFAVIGLVGGYLLFGKFAGEYMSISTLFSFNHDELIGLGRKLVGIKDAQQKVLISGGIGVVLGIVLYFFKKK